MLVQCFICTMEIATNVSIGLLQMYQQYYKYISR
uniref:Uncharacterized protein n=1 Tax=Myoviridae sp. ct4yW2 TaxID=2827286 RepID=A0A8S5RAQ4_9CAUD|nr:MAG TPA: hypothetical protein [Myoviridae sp. ct4yW2]DAO37614.1 MAG TPA: hypothetical protein [Herelleviridae sp.]